MTRLPFFNTCVAWDHDDVPALNDLIDAKVPITRRTFRRHVDLDDLARVERSLAYERHPRQGLTMAGDWHVGYFRSKLHGRTVYGFDHSHIEHVFHNPKRR